MRVFQFFNRLQQSGKFSLQPINLLHIDLWNGRFNVLNPSNGHVDGLLQCRNFSPNRPQNGIQFGLVDGLKRQLALQFLQIGSGQNVLWKAIDDRLVDDRVGWEEQVSKDDKQKERHKDGTQSQGNVGEDGQGRGVDDHGAGY